MGRDALWATVPWRGMVRSGGVVFHYTRRSASENEPAASDAALGWSPSRSAPCRAVGRNPSGSPIHSEFRCSPAVLHSQRSPPSSPPSILHVERFPSPILDECNPRFERRCTIATTAFGCLFLVAPPADSR